ncbi:hypothetical protein ACW5R3_04435 [Bizionia sp. KMM 8389]
MEIAAIIDYLTKFRKETTDLKNKKYSEKLIRVIHELEFKSFSESDLRKLHLEFDLLQQNIELDKEFIDVKTELKKFLKFIKVEYNITPQYYYTYIGFSLGLISTLLFGIFSLTIGSIFGALIGYYYDDQAKKRGKKLSTELHEFFY